jgi:RNA polymerase sigma-70 factor (ECF subfamily)
MADMAGAGSGGDGEDGDRELAARVLAGDEAAAARLVEDYSRMVGTVIWRTTGDDRAVEDLAQETFLRVFRALGRFDGRGRLSTWIYTIASRVAVDHLRRDARRRAEAPMVALGPSSREDAREEAADGPGPEDELARKEIRGIVHQELERLPEGYRLALVYTAIEGLDYPAVAAMMGIPLGTLKTYVFRGKKMLKDRIADAMRGRSKTSRR